MHRLLDSSGNSCGPVTAHDREWFDVRDLAERYKCSVRHVLRLAERGDLPPGTKFGALRRWSRSSIERAEAAR